MKSGLKILMITFLTLTLIISSGLLTAVTITDQEWTQIKTELEFNKKLIEIEEDNIDGLLCAPVTENGSNDLLMDLVNKISHVVLFDTNLPVDNKLCFVGQDSYQSGLVSGHLMNLLVPEKNTILMIQFSQDYHIKQRIKGFHVVDRCDKI